MAKVDGMATAAADQIRVWLPSKLDEVLDLQMIGTEIGVRIVGQRRRGFGSQILVEGHEGAIRSMLSDCRSRGEDARSWDQPAGWAATCRAAIPRLLAALEPHK